MVYMYNCLPREIPASNVEFNPFWIGKTSVKSCVAVFDFINVTPPVLCLFCLSNEMFSAAVGLTLKGRNTYHSGACWFHPTSVGVDRGVPNPHFPPPCPRFPPPRPRFPPPRPAFLPLAPASLPLVPPSLALEYFSHPHRRKQTTGHLII